MEDEFVLLKLGGSLITDKDTPYAPRLETLSRLAREICAALEAQPGLRLILGHGSGSFGHTAAQQYGTRDGLRVSSSSHEYWRGFAEVHLQAAELNRHVMRALREAGLPALSFPPSAAMLSQNRRAVSLPIAGIQHALAAGILPVVYGDVVFDEMLGGTILSTEDIFSALAEHFPVKRILLAGVEAGVWQDFPARDRLARRISRADFDSLRAGVGGSASVDVTGGMRAKVEGMFALIRAYPPLTAQIFSADEDGALADALLGGLPGTLLSA